jgi:hypothetical protein
MVQGVRADEKIGQDAAWTRINLLAAPHSIGLKGAPGDLPDCFVEIPIDGGICIGEEASKRFLVTRRVGEQLGESRSGARQIRALGASSSAGNARELSASSVFQNATKMLDSIEIFIGRAFHESGIRSLSFRQIWNPVSRCPDIF